MKEKISELYKEQIEKSEYPVVGAIVDNEYKSLDEELKKSQDQALTLKQDIVRRQWEKKIPLSKLECYLKGTIKKNAFTK